MVSKKFLFSLIVVFLEPLNINTKQNIPGPGTYGQVVEINKYGIYNLSTMRNSKAANWSPSKNRFIDENRLKKDLPGPGYYR